MSRADLISLARLPLAIFGCFAFLQGKMEIALATLVLSGLSDLLDGLASRKWGSSAFGAQIDMASDLYFEFTFGFILTFIGDLPKYLGVAILLRVCLQSFLLFVAAFLLKTPINIQKRRRMRMGNTLTWLVFFFVILKDIFRVEAFAAYQGLSVIALPYVFYPLCFSIEIINIYLIFSECTLDFHKKEKGS